MISEVGTHISTRANRPLNTFEVLDLFAGNGMQVGSKVCLGCYRYHAWDNDGDALKIFSGGFPTVIPKVGDSYEMLKVTEDKFDWVIVDNALHLGRHIEHFEIFPDIFRVIKRGGFLTINIFPNPQMYLERIGRKDDPHLAEIMAARRRFYGDENADMSRMVSTYRKLIVDAGRMPTWGLMTQRNPEVLFMSVELDGENKVAALPKPTSPVVQDN